MASQKAMINTLMFYHWDNTLFNEMMIPEGIDRDDVSSLFYWKLAIFL